MASRKPKLTPAQKREYEILLEYKTCYMDSGYSRRFNIYLKLCEKGLAVQDDKYKTVFTLAEIANK